MLIEKKYTFGRSLVGCFTAFHIDYSRSRVGVQIASPLTKRKDSKTGWSSTCDIKSATAPSKSTSKQTPKTYGGLFVKSVFNKTGTRVISRTS